MATNAIALANIVMLSPQIGAMEATERKKVPPRWKEKGGAILLTTAISIFVTSGVCLMTLGLSHPIFASEGVNGQAPVSINKITPEEKSLMLKLENENWDKNLQKKYRNSSVYRPTAGVAHIKMTKYINGAPVKINIVEINPKINPNLIIKPETAGQQLNAKTSIRNIARKSEALVAINGGYFKPETGVPLGSLMVDNKTLTGPIYNRVGIGIGQNQDETNFSMGRVELNIEIKNKTTAIAADNINQPRMLSTYTLVYTREWGKFSPPPPKYGAIAVIENGQIAKISTSVVEIPEDGFVVSGPAEKINNLFGQKNLRLETTYPSEFEKSNHIIGGGPYLVKNKQIYVDVQEQKLNAINGRNPRSAIGYTESGELIIVTVDGREQKSVGMTLWQLAKLMKDFDCYNAMNFDGGGSSVMYVNGQIANTPAASKEGIAISNALTIREIKG